MNGITIYEFDALTTMGVDIASVHSIPDNAYRWLEGQCLRLAEEGEVAWLRLTQRSGRRVVQVTSFVGVIRTPDGFQIEVLPKVGKATEGGATAARQLLIEMLCCLRGFRHVKTESAKLLAKRMPLLEIFIAEYLRVVERIVKRGVRSDYNIRQDNLFSLRGKLMMAPHLRQNLCRRDRFFTEHDEFTMNRPENRLLHAALRRVLHVSASQTNQQLARELNFVFADVPVSSQVELDFQRVRLDRGMNHYADALAWARLILEEDAPLTGTGGYRAPSLLFPMEAVFEAFVAKHLARQLVQPLILKAQTREQYLVRHQERKWFNLRPDLVVCQHSQKLSVLDTKWKLLDKRKTNSADKYGLAQSDFYQLYAYGHSYLNGKGDIALIYPKTEQFDVPFPVFHFPTAPELRLWVLPFCLESRQLLLPTKAESLRHLFVPRAVVDTTVIASETSS